MHGKFVAVSGNSMTITPDGGAPNVVMSIKDAATITLNGDDSTLAALKAGDGVTLTGDPATDVAATR